MFRFHSGGALWIARLLRCRVLVMGSGGEACLYRVGFLVLKTLGFLVSKPLDLLPLPVLGLFNDYFKGHLAGEKSY